MRAVSMHLMFKGDANAALDLYASVFPEFVVETIEHYGEGEGGPPGSVKQAHVTFGGQRLVVIDSPAPHDFDFTASTSIFVDCDSLEELEGAFAALAQGGQVMMPLDDYGFSRRFGWLADRFGVSWQLNLAAD